MSNFNRQDWRLSSPLSVVPLKIGNNNCKPRETYRKTPSLCKITTLDRVNLAEDRPPPLKRGTIEKYRRAKNLTTGIRPACTVQVSTSLTDMVFYWRSCRSCARIVLYGNGELNKMLTQVLTAWVHWHIHVWLSSNCRIIGIIQFN